jgi:hypothetical protein
MSLWRQVSGAEVKASTPGSGSRSTPDRSRAAMTFVDIPNEAAWRLPKALCCEAASAATARSAPAAFMHV